MESSAQSNVLCLVDSLGEIRGRKKLQKMVFLLETFGAPFAERFDFHLYGPYSDELANEVQWFVETGRLTEERVSTAGGFAEYVYRLIEGSAPQGLQPGVIEVARQMNEKSARFLELAATIRYLMEQGAGIAAATEQAKAIKPSQRYSDEESHDAVELMEQWGRQMSAATSAP